MEARDPVVAVARPQLELLEDQHLVLGHLRVEVPPVRRVVFESQDLNRVASGRNAAVQHGLVDDVFAFDGGRVQNGERERLNRSLHSIGRPPPVDVLVLSHLASPDFFQFLTDVIVHDILVVLFEHSLITREVRMDE